MNLEFLDVQAEFRKSTGTRDQIVNIRWIIEKRRVPGKHLFLLYWLHQSLSLCGSQPTGKFLKRWEYQITWPATWEICMQVKKQQLELDMVQWTGSKLGKDQGCILSPCLFNLYAEYIMWNAGLMKHKLESSLPGEIAITSDIQMTPPFWQKAKSN